MIGDTQLKSKTNTREINMNRLALVAATGFLTLALTACGEHGNSKPTVVTPDNTPVSQEQVAPVQPVTPEPTTEDHTN